MKNKFAKIHVAFSDEGIFFVMNKHAIRKLHDGEPQDVKLNLNGQVRTFTLLRDTVKEKFVPKQ